MIWKDITNNSEVWMGLKLELNENSNSNSLLESGHNCRFKLCIKSHPVLWGTLGKQYWGVWVLINPVRWESTDMPVAPINSATIEKSRNEDYYRFWSRFFAKQLGNKKAPYLSKGLWTITIGSSYKSRSLNTSVIIYDIDNAYSSENPRWIGWEGESGNIIALKNEPYTESGRVKWYRKLIRENCCPPVLVWYLTCLSAYIIIDGHDRLKAFQSESSPTKFLVLSSIREEQINKDPKVQQNILFGIQQRQKRQTKSKMTVDEINKLLISAFDTRPYCYSITRAKARANFDKKWISEVKALANNLNSSNIQDMIDRIEP
ncbi:hypothetical protein [Fulvivirga sediminis]|uniref:ParB/Sulfiredoxin domain-containing protein n=1 Tax=Fulvivirga sediminis TaxID=2803949 RepID=A0A937F8E4_9BACT|nr:hypothetical protein [Fulvivirga sediminis]MBL3655878.1 hypothetical protein [Fulvivirga sediminis]